MSGGRGSVREYAIDSILRGRGVSSAVVGGGNVVLNAGQHALDGPEHTHLDAYVKSTQGGEETLEPHGASGSAATLDLADGNWHSLTLDDDCTVTPTGFTAALGCSALVKVTQDGSGGHAIVWDGVVFAAGADDQPAQDPDAVSWFVLASDVGDGTIYGFPVGSGGASFDTPAITLGTAAADGVATTVIRSDSTIEAFDDGTDPTTAAFGDTPDTGADAHAARLDHRHGMPAEPVPDGLLTVDPGTPTYDTSGDDVVTTIAAVWGYDGDGPYYDSGGVVSGEEAVLALDPTTGELVAVPYIPA